MEGSETLLFVKFLFLHHVNMKCPRQANHLTSPSAITMPVLTYNTEEQGLRPLLPGRRKLSIVRMNFLYWLRGDVHTFHIL